MNEMLFITDLFIIVKNWNETKCLIIGEYLNYYIYLKVNVSCSCDIFSQKNDDFEGCIIRLKNINIKD